ncbi:MAG: sulfatase/phosphatase domain-containing protein, partial [Methylococcales bacterium]
AKTGYFEGGLRTPMAILIPGLTRPQRIETAVSNLDVAKTFLAAGGVSDDSELPGRDLRPLIAGQSIEQKSLYWEYRHRKRGYIFGIMSADGRWRYGQDPSLGEALYDIEADPAGRINLVKSEAHQDILADLLVDYRNWHDAHRLLFYGTVGEQPVLVSKRGMQRTPGFDSVTWGFAVRPLSATEDEILLNQPGVGSIHMNQTMAQVKLFGYSLHATWNHEANCQTILLATDTISPGVFHKDYHFTADLYVNGKKADSLILRQKLSKQQNHEAMRVFPANGVVQAYLVWGEYVVEKDSLANPGVERIIKRLCPESS